MPHTRFTKEFRDEAVRLALTSGRSRREIAEDLGVGLSTLRHWIDRRREREIDDPPEERQEDMAAELKRLRRENEILRQEREILKKATMDSTGQRTMIDSLVSERIHDGAYRAAGLVGGAEKGTLGPVESWRVAERHRPCSWRACRVSLWRCARQGSHCSIVEDTLSAFAHVRGTRGYRRASQPSGRFTRSRTGFGGHARPSAGSYVGMEAERGIVPRDPMSVLGNRIYIRKLAFSQSRSLFTSW